MAEKICSNCQGTGFLAYEFDPSPAGVSLAAGKMVDMDPCPLCYELGLCPRCGKALGEDMDGELAACACGWTAKWGMDQAANNLWY